MGVQRVAPGGRPRLYTRPANGNNGAGTGDAKTGATEREKQMGFLDKAKSMMAKNTEKIDAAIDKTGDFVDSKTQGKYADTVDKVQDAAKKALGDEEHN
jgi:hypothetical protein